MFTNKMRLSIKVIPNSKQEKIIKENERLRVYVKAQAIEGKANKSLIELLSKYFNTKKNNITIISGLKSRNKIIEIQNENTWKSTDKR